MLTRWLSETDKEITGADVVLVCTFADVAASTVIYGVKTAVNVVDAVTPDIINRDKDKSKK